ncbi:hypothetical protein ACTA71_002698 [Dictyostelium dimigraforme]
MTDDIIVLESFMNKTKLKNEKDNSILFFKIWRNLDLRVIEIQFFKFERKQLIEIISELPNNITGLILRNLNYLKGPTIHITDADSFNSLGTPFTKGLLPNHLIVFSFDQVFNMEITEINSFPKNLKYLEFGKFFNHSLNYIVEEDEYGFNEDENEDENEYENEEDENESENEIKSENEIEIENQFGKSILPKNLIELKFHPKSMFNQIIHENTLPKTLVILSFGMSFNQELKANILPKGLKELEFGYLYNQPIKRGVLPEGLLKLKFGNYFNQSLPNGVLPSTLEVLKFGTEFNQKIHGNNLPKSLKEVSFDSTSIFNQSIDSCNIIDCCSSSCSSSSSSSSNEYCNECGDNGSFSTLKNLTKLDIGYGFQHSLTKNSIPNSVLYLSLGGWLSIYSLATVVNSGMNPSSCKSIPPNVLPNSITNLRVDPSYMVKKGSIPESVTKVDGLNYKFSKFLPINLKKLKLNDDFNDKLKGALDLPKDLETLDMGGHFNEIIPPNSLPGSIEKLKLSTNFSKPLKFGSLPITIRNLYLGISFNDPVFSFPPFLETLNFGEVFNLSFNSNLLPKSLRSLRFGSNFNQDIEQFQFPQSLTLLELGQSFSHSINSNWLSKSNIKTLIIKSSDAFFSLPLPDPTIEIFIFSSNSKFLRNPINQSIFLDNPSFLINSIKIINEIHFGTLFSKLSKL